MNQITGAHSVDLLLDRIGLATMRVLASAAALKDEQVREDSLLPGWSRGHVLTHIARNADGLRNMLTWARTGVETPMYASREARDAEIEAGADRSAAELAADIAESADTFAAAAAEVPEEGWQTEVRAIRGPAHPAWYVLHRRLFEIEVHHVDLAATYQPSDWPDWFVDEHIYRIIGDLTAKPDSPVALLTDTETGRQFFLGAADGDAMAVSGPGYLLLAWLLGRSDGDGLIADPAGPLPDVPPYG